MNGPGESGPPAVTDSPRASGSGFLRVAFATALVVLSPLVLVAGGVAFSGCTPIPVVGYDAALDDAGDSGRDARSVWYVEAGDAGDADAGDSEAGPAHVRREWDAGVEDDAFPSAADGELELRMKHLLEAIAAGDPALAPDLLYPRDAWVRSRDATDPGKAWDNKVKPVFLRDIAKLHKRQKGIERAKFVSFELGHALAHAGVKSRDLKKPVWRVRGSKLTYTIDDKQKHMVVAEMTSFRGAWYVTKLR